MGAPANPSFEAAGSVGLPANWYLSVISTAEEIADFGPVGEPRAREAFEAGWENDSFILVLATGDLGGALFDAALESFEDFEQEWHGNENFVFLLVLEEALAIEAFESAWANDAFLLTFAPGDISAALFDVALQAFEDFEQEWHGNENFAFFFGPGDEVAAQFNAGTLNFETFESVRPPVGFSANFSTDVFTAPAHGFANGERVTVATTGVLPAGLDKRFDYFVVSATTNTFQLALSVGGAAIDVTTPGTGSHSLVADKSLYWTSVLD